MTIYAPDSLNGFAELEENQFNTVLVTFKPKWHMGPRVGSFDGINIEVCGESHAYAWLLKRHSSKVLYEQQVTLVHELLHRYNWLKKNPEELREVTADSYEEEIDAAAYRLVRDHSPEEFDDMICDMSVNGSYYFDYQTKGRNPFYVYHLGLYKRRIRRAMPVYKTQVLKRSCIVFG